MPPRSQNPLDLGYAATAPVTSDSNNINYLSLSTGQSIATTTSSTLNSRASVQYSVREADKAALDAQPDIQYSLRR